MIRTMVPRAGVALTTALILSACGGGGGGSATGPDANASSPTALNYSYPLNQQTEVPTPAPVVLNFSNSISGTDVENSITLHQGHGAAGATVAVAAKTANNGKSLVLTPDDDLAPHTAYSVVIAGSSTVKNRTIGFTTRALQEGPKSEVVSADTMKLKSMFPDGSSNEPMMDFSTLRLRFTQPMDRATVSYGDGPGDTVALLDKNSDVVPAHMIVDGPYLTIDPKDNLTPGEHYTLHFANNQVKSTYGEAFYYVDNSTYQITPKSSLAQGKSESQRPRPLVQKITQNGTSPLTGNPLNVIPVNATLLGDDNNIQQSGDVLGDLAFLPRYPTVSPLSIRRGTLLKGASIKVNIGGKVYAGFDTGEVDVRFLSDASGYLIPNPYSNSPDAPRLVKLFMDVAISAENPTANAGVTQNITQLELIGTALTDTDAGVININAVGVVEPSILGQERGYGTLSFQLQTYKDQTKAPALSKDTTGPFVQSWNLGGDLNDDADKELLYSPGDPIIINFNEAIDPDSVAGNADLYRNGMPQEVEAHADGAALIISPKEPLEYNFENNPNLYEVQIGAEITDIEGNPIESAFDKKFHLSTLVQNKTVVTPWTGRETRNDLVNHAPVVLALYPGFPCALDTSALDLASGVQGRCAGSMPSVTDGLPADNHRADDLIPIGEISGNRPIIVNFSKPIDSHSIKLGSSFKVEKVDESGNSKGDVSGRIVVKPKEIFFIPDQPWVVGQKYKYIIGSGGYDIDSSSFAPAYVATNDYLCDGSDAVCDKSGLPLQTQTLGAGKIQQINGGTFHQRIFARRGPGVHAGGPDLVQYFVGKNNDDSVMQILRAAPESDSNANFFSDRDTAENYSGFKYTFDEEERGPTNIPDPYSDSALDPNGVRPSANSAKILSKFRPDTYPSLISAINIGCDFETPIDFSNPQPMECPEYKFTYLSSALIAEVTDQVDPDKGVKVIIWPSQIMASSLDIMAALSLAPGTQYEDQASLNNTGATGPQILRMRYEDWDGDGARTDPIVGWITEEPGEGPVLNADVDLYLDAPDISVLGTGFNQSGHNLNSYPLSMQLKGAVSFLDDGRMLVRQYNLNTVVINLDITNSSGGRLAGSELTIPPNDNILQYISQSIK